MPIKFFRLISYNIYLPYFTKTGILLLVSSRVHPRDPLNLANLQIPLLVLYKGFLAVLLVCSARNDTLITIKNYVPGLMVWLIPQALMSAFQALQLVPPLEIWHAAWMLY